MTITAKERVRVLEILQYIGKEWSPSHDLDHSNWRDMRFLLRLVGAKYETADGGEPTVLVYDGMMLHDEARRTIALERIADALESMPAPSRVPAAKSFRGFPLELGRIGSEFAWSLESTSASAHGTSPNQERLTADLTRAAEGLEKLLRGSLGAP